MRSGSSARDMLCGAPLHCWIHHTVGREREGGEASPEEAGLAWEGGRRSTGEAGLGRFARDRREETESLSVRVSWAFHGLETAPAECRGDETYPLSFQ
jgi:hypothetical protein